MTVDHYHSAGDVFRKRCTDVNLFEIYRSIRLFKQSLKSTLHEKQQTTTKVLLQHIVELYH